MHIFDYRFLRESEVDSDLLKRLLNIERIRGKSSKMLDDNDSVAYALENRAILMSVVGSNAIEGIVTSEERAVGLISGDTRPRGHDENEILGYRDALKLIHMDHSNMRIDKETILGLYRTMMQYSVTEDVGFKTRDNVVIVRDPGGYITGQRPTVPASGVEDAIEQLVLAYAEVRDDENVQSLLLIPCFIMDFLMIHPFPDGNGRMSRLLTTLLLYQEGYDIGRYISMESKINASRDDYYDAIADSQNGWFDNGNDYAPFISYFLGQLFLCYRDLNRFTGEQIGRSRKSNALEEYLRICPFHVSKKDLCLMFPEVSAVTVSRVLSRMVKDGELEMAGAGRATRYMSVKNKLN